MVVELELPSDSEMVSIMSSDNASSSDEWTPRCTICPSLASTAPSNKSDTDDDLPPLAKTADAEADTDASVSLSLSKSARRRQRRQILHKVITAAKADTCDSSSVARQQIDVAAKPRTHFPAFHTVRPPALAVSASECSSPPTSPPSGPPLGLLGTRPKDGRPCEASARAAPCRTRMGTSPVMLQSIPAPSQAIPMPAVPRQDVMFVNLSPASVDRYHATMRTQPQLFSEGACPAQYIATYALAPASASSVVKEQPRGAESTRAVSASPLAQCLMAPIPHSPVNVVVQSMSAQEKPSNDRSGLGVSPLSILASILSPDGSVARSLAFDGKSLAEQLRAAAADNVYYD